MDSRKRSYEVFRGTALNETSGDLVGPVIDIPHGRSAVLYIDLSVFSGNTETLNGVLEAIDPVSGRAFTIATITELLAVGGERVVTGLVAFPDMKVRWNPTMTGTTVVATYTVSLVVSD